MFELSLGTQKDKQVVSEWHKQRSDNDVQLWTSLFLLEFDKTNYDRHLAEVQNVLDKCDGVTYYPHAIKPLLRQNEPKAKQMAEGILKKDRFLFMCLFGDDNELLKLLVINKSDTTFNFLIEGLNNFEADKGGLYNAETNHSLLKCDLFVQAVAQWRDNNKIEYRIEWPLKKRQEYCRALSHWLTEQYELLKAGKESTIKSRI